MNKIVVGILPQIKLGTDDNPYNDKYEFLDLYTKKIIECGGIPIGICLNNGILDYNSLEICDAFLLPGGNKIWNCYYEVIDYAIKNNKPLLGICLGFQALAIYSIVSENILKDNNFLSTYSDLKDSFDGSFLKKLDSPNIHQKVFVNYNNSDEARHEIDIIDKESILYDIFNQNKLNVVSIHSYTSKDIGKKFKITAICSCDDVVEAIEYNNKDYFIVGVCWHPEWDNDKNLFKRLILEGEKRK